MKKQKLEIITCPYCGREYLPSEIFLPKSFIGDAKSIVRTTAGKIDTFFGQSMDLKESYVCDKCLGEFNVSARVSFFTKKVDNQFQEEYRSKINKKICLKED